MKAKPMTPAEKTQRNVKYWEIAIKATIPLCLLLGSVLIAHEVRISAIEEARFTTEDGHDLKEEMRGMFPPPWLKEDIDEIKTSLKEVSARLRALERGG